MSNVYKKVLLYDENLFKIKGDSSMFSLLNWYHN